MLKRVVITGVGVITSIGIGKDLFWKNLIGGKSGISQVSSFDTQQFPTHYGAEIKEPLPQKFLREDCVQSMGKATQMGLCAARMAIEDAGLREDEINRNRAGVMLGTTMGEIHNLEECDDVWVGHSVQDLSQVCQRYPSHNISNSIAQVLGFRADNLMIPCACAAGNFAIGYAYDMLRSGRTEFMLAGGAEVFSRITFTGFSRLLSMASERCSPFDKNRDGIIIGEGAGIVALETLDSALKRKANIYAEIKGYGISCDAYHMTLPQFGGILAAILFALRDANVKPEKVDYINAHGTGTPINDKTECLALKKVFRNGLKDIPVSSSKSMLGHCLGAASAIEAIACALTIQNGIVPPTINYVTPDPECDIDCVPNVCREHKVDVALNNGFAFGGNNACLVLKRCD